MHTARDSRAGECLPETELHHAWSLADHTRAQVTDSEGGWLKVIYSGMPGGSYGPDFRQAVLERDDGTEIIGDVEIHVRSREWYAHGHAEDTRYSGVRLHGVWAASDGGGCVTNAAGLAVPQVGLGALHGRLTQHAARRENGVASGDRLPARIVENAGDEWFAGKVKMYESEIDTCGDDLALQLGVFDALGYSRNRWQFRHLGRRVPWHYLKLELSRTAELGLSAATIAERVLRWGAGFDDVPEWARAPVLADEAPDWNRAYGMPANSPEKRIRGAAALAAGWHEAGGPMLHAVDAVRNAGRCSELWHATSPSGSGIGSDRAKQIAVNVLLPFVAAWARRGGDAVLYAHAVQLFKAHPPLPENSVLTESLRYLGERGIAHSAPRRRLGARCQQGAMHLYQSDLNRPRRTRQLILPA